MMLNSAYSQLNSKVLFANSSEWFAAERHLDLICLVMKNFC